MNVFPCCSSVACIVPHDDTLLCTLVLELEVWIEDGQPDVTEHIWVVATSVLVNEDDTPAGNDGEHFPICYN